MFASSSTPGPPCCACPAEAAHCNNGLCTASAEAGGDSLYEEEVNKTEVDGPDGQQIILFGTTVTSENWRLDCPPSTTQASTTAVATAAPPASPAPTNPAPTPAPGKLPTSAEGIKVYFETKALNLLLSFQSQKENTF